MSPTATSVATPLKRRDDLVLSEQQSDGATTTVIKDPRTGRFFRFGPFETYLFSQLDGATSIDALKDRTEAHFGASLPLTTLEQFIRRLDSLGLLQKEDDSARETGRRRLRGNLFYLRLRLFDPDA